MYKFKFADIGEGLHEGTVGEVYLKEGDKVNEGDSLFSVETDKVTSDIPSPVAGTISKVLIKQGETVHVGDVTMHIDDGSGEDAEEAAPAPKADAEEADETKEESASVVGDIKVSNEKMTSFAAPSKANNSGERKLATPFSRKLAAEKGIDINVINGTGHNGRVLAKDIENAKPGASGSAGITSGNFGETFSPYEVKVTGMRKAIANAMKNSWGNVAYTNLVNEVNMTKLWDERKALVPYIQEKYGVKVSFTALIALATVKGLKKFSMLNAKFDEASNTLKHDGIINLGIAVDTPKGLVVPTIKNAESKNVVELAQTIIELATKARDGKLTAADMSGGTFTITNYGSAGAMWGVPVINYPEIGILGTGTIVDRVFAKGTGEFYNGKVMNLTCAADHRWIDGADIGRFITYVKELLENPLLLLGGL